MRVNGVFFFFFRQDVGTEISAAAASNFIANCATKRIGHGTPTGIPKVRGPNCLDGKNSHMVCVKKFVFVTRGLVGIFLTRAVYTRWEAGGCICTSDVKLGVRSLQIWKFKCKLKFRCVVSMSNSLADRLDTGLRTKHIDMLFWVQDRIQHGDISVKKVLGANIAQMSERSQSLLQNHTSIGTLHC